MSFFDPPSKPPPLATVLPRSAALALQQAALTPKAHDADRSRQMAIEHTTARIKTDYPQFFQVEKEFEYE